MSDFNKEVGLKIKELRKQSGLTMRNSNRIKINSISYFLLKFTTNMLVQSKYKFVII